MIIVDIETTGVDPHKHAIIDIAARDFLNPENSFHSLCQVREGAEIDDYALEYNGFTKEEITDERLPTLKEAVLAFLEWTKTVENRTIAGQNVDFDIGFLKYAFDLYDIKWELGHRKVDQHSLTYALALKKDLPLPLNDRKSSNFYSDTIMEFVGIPSEPKPHKAPNGVTWETEAMSRLIYGKSLLKEFEEYEVPEYLRES